MAYGSAPRHARVRWGNCLIVLAALGTIGYLYWQRNLPNRIPFGGATATGDGGRSARPTQTGDILFYYGRSTRQWMERAAEEFNKQHEGRWRIVLATKGSREGKQDILYGRGKPVLWSPADVYWTDKLNLDWTSPRVGRRSEDVIGENRPILRSLFVLIMWEDRARVFEAAMRDPKYRDRTWTLLYDLATRGWSAIGGPARWGRLRLAQTEATESNSGQAVLALMFAEYRQSHPDADTADPGFLRFMRAIEGTVVEFRDTTSRMVEAFVNGGPEYADIALAYESNAIAAIDRGETNLRVVYPEPTVATDYPAAILRAPWVTSDQAEGARAFVDYLLTPEVQKRALETGFRPVLEELRGAVDTALARGRRAGAGFRLDARTVMRPVSTRLIDGLLYQWHKTYGQGG